MLDYMVMEAVAMKAQKQDEKAAQDAKKRAWKKDRDKLKELQ